MKRRLALLALVLVGCGEGLTVPVQDASTDGVGTNCCVQYTSGLPVPGCWMCKGIVRCVTTLCESATTLPRCSVQPDGPYSAERPECL